MNSFSGGFMVMPTIFRSRFNIQLLIDYILTVIQHKNGEHPAITILLHNFGGVPGQTGLPSDI